MASRSTQLPSSKLRGKVVPVSQISENERREMFALFRRYYESVSYRSFCADLHGKDEVIVLRDAERHIQGISTLRSIHVHQDGKRHRGIFSGDTVVAREYWGQRVLGKVFLRYLLAQKLKEPHRPLWWFLITKGYKTYLLMANNFAEHYPRYEAPTPRSRQALLTAFAKAYFPENFREDTGLIEFDHSHGHLKSSIAPITDDMRRNPRIAFFEAQNPNWSEGAELACIARMTWSMPLYYSLKAFAKTTGLQRLKARAAQALPAR